MDLTRLLRTPIIVEHVTLTGPPNEMGDPTEVRTWTRFLGYVWQTQAQEATDGGLIATQRSEVVLPRSADGHIDASDRIYERGELDASGDYIAGTGTAYDVDGPPWTALNPRTQLREFVHARLVQSQ